MAKVNALRAPTPHPEGQNIIAVASGKGGVGKTWLAISLAHAFAKSQKQVLLFDGDLGLANVDVQLGLMPKRDIANVIGGEISLQQAAFPFGAGGFDIIAGRSGSGTLASLNGPKLARLRDDLAILSAQYDRVIVDLGAGLANSVQAFSEHFGTTLVVLTDEPTSLVDAYAYIKLQVLQRPAADIRIVINQAKNNQDGERTYATLRKACENFLSLTFPLAAVIRRDPHVKESIRAQTSLLTRHPASDAARDVEALARKLMGGK